MSQSIAAAPLRLSVKTGLSQSKDRPSSWRGGGGLLQEKLLSEAYRATKGIARNSIAHRCPTYQLHVPRECDLGTPTTLSREMPENSRKILAFLLKKIGTPRERPIQGIPENSFWGPQIGILVFALPDENDQS